MDILYYSCRVLIHLRFAKSSLAFELSGFLRDGWHDVGKRIRNADDDRIRNARGIPEEDFPPCSPCSHSL